MMDTLFWVCAGLLLLLLAAPVVTYIVVNWKHRSQEILSGVNSEGNAAIKRYFKEFQHDFLPSITDPDRRFRAYYNAHFGRKQFVIPALLLFIVTGVLLFMCKKILDAPVPADKGFLETKGAIAVFAVMGAYLWVVYDQIKKWWHSSLSPRDVYEASFRFALAIPFGFSIAQLTTGTAGPMVAFFMGAFPMQTLLSASRNIFGQKLGLQETEAVSRSELLNLQGIDPAKADRLIGEGITTICQLAYADPIRLTIRTNLGYSYLIDCISQALLRIYTGPTQPEWDRHGIRGGFEAMKLTSGLEEGDAAEKEEAQKIVEVLAESLKVPVASIKNILWQVCHDPYMEFLFLSWTSSGSLPCGNDGEGDHGGQGAKPVAPPATASGK